MSDKKDDIAAQLDFLKSVNDDYTRGDIWQLCNDNELLIYFVDDLEINTLGTRETAENVYVICTVTKEVIAIGTPGEVGYLFTAVNEYLKGARKTIGDLKLTFVLKKGA
jgi:hypothetical protein